MQFHDMNSSSASGRVPLKIGSGAGVRRAGGRKVGLFRLRLR